MATAKSQYANCKCHATPMGHEFDDDLRCKRCNVTWSQHQERKKPCDGFKRPMGQMRVVSIGG